MSNQSQMQLTPAEQAVVAAAEALAGQDRDGAVRAGRLTAVNMLKSAGLPTRRQERWHYTDLRALVSEADIRSAQDAPDADGPAFKMVNGRFVGVPAGSDTMDVHHGMQPIPAPTDPLDHVIKVLNSALLSDEIGLNFSGNHADHVALQIETSAGAPSHGRMQVSVAEGATAAIVIDQKLDAGSLGSFVMDMQLAAESRLTVVLMAEDDAAAKSLVNLGGSLGEKAILNIICLNTGAGFSRTELEFQARGDGSHIGLYGAHCLAGKQMADTTLIVDHQCLDSTSEELFKYIGRDSSRGIFQGRINVHPDAQKTDAQMMANALLLSDGAEFLSKPELEIFADDVQCAHGCTAGELDEDQLFYLMSRGIPRPEAEKLLILSFVAGVFDEVEDEQLTETLQGRVTSWLDRQHGDG